MRSPRETSTSSLEQDGDGHRRERLVDRAVEGVQPRDARARLRREHDDLVAGPQDAPRHLARVASVVGGVVAHDPLDSEAGLVDVAIVGDVDGLQVLEQRQAAVPGHPLGSLHDVVAVQRADRHVGEVAHVQATGELGELAHDRVEGLLVVVDEVHLVDGDREVGDAQQRGDEGVALGLLEDALARVDEDHREVGRRRAGDHVARVLNVAGGVGDDELAPRAWRSSGRRRRS